MINREILEDILRQYEPRSISQYKYQIDCLKTKLKEWAYPYLIDIDQCGSFAKGTAISCSSDLDLFISLKSTIYEDEKFKHKEICESLYEFLNYEYLKDKYYDLSSLSYRLINGENIPEIVRKQNVSTRLLLGYEVIGNPFTVDITPAVKESGNTGYHWIYSSKKKSRTRTNVKKHIDDISKSKRLNEIKLIKIWAFFNFLEFPSIYIEYLIVNEILKYKNFDKLYDNFIFILTSLAKNEDNPLYKKLLDPSNQTNVLSDLLNKNEKLKIIACSIKSLKDIKEGSISTIFLENEKVP